MKTLPDANEFKERVVIVTGAANSLGLAIAQRLVAGGAKVLLVDQDKSVLQRVGSADLPPTAAVAIVKDLADDDAAVFVFDQVRKLLGQANALINNAAWSFHKAMLDVTHAEFDRLVRINQRAPYFLAQEFCRSVLNSQGPPEDPVIINIASVNALRGNVNLAAYAGTKGALTAMTRAMAVEMAPHGIRVNSISPGSVDTMVLRSLVDAGVISPPKLFERLLNKRFASCAEIAEVVAYLCSSRATYVNGVNWIIDGGYLAG
jgi:meso-butanediol dehydrogenase/(S,S)-butanediol dehydrogenase/diacetyl reductase